MLKNYLKIAWRNLVQNKSHSIINIVGLSIGMACCILIALYARQELSYDDFHENADRIVAMGRSHPFFGDGLSTPYPLSREMEEQIPEVEQATRIRRRRAVKLSGDGNNFTGFDGRYAESDFFKIFSFEVLEGQKRNLLDSPNEIVITSKTSKKLFGDDNSSGKSIYWQRRDTVEMLQVSAVVENPPALSSITFDALISMKNMDEDRRRPDGWGGYMFRTFAILDQPADHNLFTESINDIIRSNYDKEDEEKVSFFTIPLTALHLSSLTNNQGFIGDRSYLYLFGAVAIFILLIACVNYVNLATARVSVRAVEVGIRKSVGASRGQLAVQFLGESVVLSLVSYLVGIGLAELILPFFNQVFGTSLVLLEHGVLLLWLGMGAIIIGLLAGLYPALYLVRFSPLSILRNRLPTGESRSTLRKTLVVGQFAIALTLIMGSLVIYEQIQFAQNKDLGFEGEGVVSVDFPNRQSWRLKNEIKRKLRKNPLIGNASVADAVPGGFSMRLGLKPQEFSPEENTPSEETISVTPAGVDSTYLEVLDIKLIAGSNFSKRNNANAKFTYIINQKLAEKLGWTPEEAIGKPMSYYKGDSGPIVGVTENYHIQSLRSEIDPVVMQYRPEGPRRMGQMLVKLKPDNFSGGLDAVKTTFSEYAPKELLNYNFLDDRFEAMYQTERRFGKITASFTIIAILIACLGLYGLASFAAERRTKEIGIRKVVGASVQQILWLLNKDFLKLVLIGFVIAVPIAWYAMHRWLQNFAYKVDIGADIFLIAGLGALFIAILTVSWQSIKAALMNPADSIRMEG